VSLGIFVRGLLVGFSIAAPVGPIGVLCIRRTLADGRLIGLVTGLGAATADATYASVAGFGITAISGLLLGGQLWLRLVGGAFLCYLGVRTFLSRPAERPATAGGLGVLGAYGSALALTLTNPATILSFAAIFAGLGALSTGGSYRAAAELVGGVFTGSALWWVILSSVVTLARARTTPGALRWVNRLSGAILLGFGALAFASLLV